MAKRVLAAGIVKDLHFDSQAEMELYLYFLKHRKVEYQVLEVFLPEDGSAFLRIILQYNNSDFIKLFE